MELLLEILSAKRPHNDPYEKAFVQKTIVERIESLGHTVIKTGPMENLVVIIPTNEKGDVNKVLFSCHTDTVHHTGGENKIIADANLGVVYTDGKGHDCLGADDGTGVWIMLKMIEAGKPGTYVFHRGEEKGCVGSYWMSQDKSTQEFLKKYDVAVAFDRKDHDDVITHQRGRRCCSEEFATALAKALNDTHVDFKYKPSPHGIYTDTANYDELIKECTNLSVGYDGAHSAGEMQDLNHARALLAAAIQIDWEKLPAVRVAKRDYGYQYPEVEHWGSRRGNFGATGRSTQPYGNAASAGQQSLQAILAALSATYISPVGRNRMVDASVRAMGNPPMTMPEIMDEALKKEGVDGVDDYLMALVKFQPELALVALRSGLVYYQYYMLTLSQTGVQDRGILGTIPIRTNFLLNSYESGKYGILFDKEKKEEKPTTQLTLVETDPVKQARAARKAEKKRRKELKKQKANGKRALRRGRSFTHGLSAGTLEKIKEGVKGSQSSSNSPSNIVPYINKDNPDLAPAGPTNKNISQ